MEAHSTCPVCGSHPVVSVIRSDGPTAGLRYVHCTLCNTRSGPNYLLIGAGE
jgi:FdhE protein